MQDPDIFRIQIEIQGEQRAQLPHLAAPSERLPQFHHTAPLVSRGRARRPGAAREEMRVVLGSHGIKPRAGKLNLP